MHKNYSYLTTGECLEMKAFKAGYMGEGEEAIKATSGVKRNH
jgi:hypothetical protein